jgi:type I restriction enzyme S subunit
MEKTINECFFQIQNGANIKQGDIEGGFPITRIETTANDKFNRDRMGYAGITDISKYEAYVLEDGDLLMSHINSVQYLGRTVLYVKQPDETIIHGMNLLRLKARRNIINPAYARYCFYGHTFRCQIGNITKKSVNQASFAVKDLKQIKIEVPSLDEQNKVVVILDRVQKLIDMRNDELASLDDLIKARFVEMFGDPIINSRHLETKDLKDVMLLKAGDFTVASDIADEQTETNPYPCYGGNGIRGYVSEYNQEGDYSLVGRQGALSGNVQYASGKFKNTEHALLVTPIVEMNSIWLHQLLLNLDLKRYQTGAAQPGLSVKNLQEIQVILAPIDEQNRFAEFVKRIDKSKVAVQKALDETQLLFNSLMQKYFG